MSAKEVKGSEPDHTKNTFPLFSRLGPFCTAYPALLRAWTDVTEIIKLKSVSSVKLKTWKVFDISCKWVEAFMQSAIHNRSEYGFTDILTFWIKGWTTLYRFHIGAIVVAAAAAIESAFNLRHSSSSSSCSSSSCVGWLRQWRRLCLRQRRRLLLLLLWTATAQDAKAAAAD